MTAETFLNEVQRAIIESPPPQNSKTFLETVRREYDENFISDYLASLLQNESIQKSLLPVLLREQNQSHFPRPQDVNIHREYTLDEHNRIDLLVEVGENSILAIENKILSPEGRKQTEVYKKLLERHFRGRDLFCYVLSPEFNRVHSRTFEAITYRQLYEMLALPSFITELDSDALLRLRDFLTHVERYLMKSNRTLVLHGLSKLYVQNLDTIEKLEDTFKKDCENYFAYIRSLVEEHFPEPEWQHSYSSGYFQVFKPHWSRKALSIHFEIWTHPRKLLTCDWFEVMVDAERPGREAFYKAFETKGKELISKQRRKGYLYRPPARKIAVAFKIVKYPKQIVAMEASDWKRLFTAVFSNLDQYVNFIDKFCSR